MSQGRQDQHVHFEINVVFRREQAVDEVLDQSHLLLGDVQDRLLQHVVRHYVVHLVGVRRIPGRKVLGLNLPFFLSLLDRFIDRLDDQASPPGLDAL